LDRPVLNLWNYSRRPRVLYPVAGLPCWSGIHTRWNMRPCPAALNGYNIFSGIIGQIDGDIRAERA
ncbi:MAG: hypothetical protein ABIN18_06400, partial [Pseudomonadota bacterium]